MIKIEKIDIWGFIHALRGMRNPLESWEKSDSVVIGENLIIGESDFLLMKSLVVAGTEHRKFMRQIFVSFDITAPLYWWKEFDTYKVGTVSNSCSTMHNIHKRDLTIEDFSCEYLDNGVNYEEKIGIFKTLIECINTLRQMYINTKNKRYWYSIIQLLPSSYNQKRTITMNYENAYTMIQQRQNHKLDEWHKFCDTLTELPHMKRLL